MNNIDWLNSLDRTISGNANKFLDVLEIDLKNYYKIKISGNSFRATTINAFIEMLVAKKIDVVNVNYLTSVNYQDYVKVGFKTLDMDSLDFHIGCIKTIKEELGLDISFYEAMFLIGLNYLREQKLTYFVVDASYDFMDIIEYDKVVSNIDEIDNRDYKIYQSELCSFYYYGLDYDMPQFGPFMAKYIIPAIKLFSDLYIKHKPKKIRKVLINMPSKGLVERVNINPRIILNIIDSNDIDLYISYVKETFKKNIVTVSNSDNYKSNYIINSKEELVNIINSVKTNDCLLIVGDSKFIFDIRPLFFK